MKSYLYWIIGLLAFIMLVFIISFRNIVNSITIYFKFIKFDFKDIKLFNVVVNSSIDVNVESEITIENNSLFNINISDLSVDILYRDQLFAKSKSYKVYNPDNSIAISDSSTIKIMKGSATKFLLPLLVTIDSNSINLATQYARKIPFEITYIVKFKIYGFTAKIKDTYIETYNEKDNA